MKKTLFAAAAVLLGVNVSYAGESVFDSLKDLAAPSALSVPAPEPAKAPVVSTAVPSGGDFGRWFEKFKEDTEDSICKAAQLKLNQNAHLVSVLGVGGGFGRSLKQSPDQKIALVDEVALRLSLTADNGIIPFSPVHGLGVSISGQLEGKSQVVRPLGSTRYCDELGTWAKLYEVKVVVPAKAERIAKMEIGEIWKLPLSMKLAFSASLGASFNEMVNVSVSAGGAKERRPSVTLYRMADDQLRLRLRLDRVTVYSVGASVSSAEIPVSDLGFWEADNILANFVNKTVAKEINKFISMQLSVGHSRNFGKKLLLEFVLNPKDPRQMEALEKFLQGDFGIIKRFVELGLPFNDFSAEDTSANGMGELSGVSDQALQAIGGKPTFSGSDIYSGHANNLHFQVPVINTHDVSWSASYNRYQSMDRNGETLHVQERKRTSNSKSLSVPFMGANVKHNSERTFYVVNREGADGKASLPALMYQQNEGIVKHTDGSARDLVERANGVLRYVGMKGEGVNEEETLPRHELFPSTGGTFKTYKSVVMNFSLLISERGLQDILLAPAQAIVKAYLNVMRELMPDIVNRISGLFSVNAAGKVSYDRQAAEKRMAGIAVTEGYNPMDDVKILAHGAEEVIKDLAAVRNAPGWKAQSATLAAVATGKSHSDFGYEDFLKVVVQLTDPLNVSAQVFLSTDKKVKGEADVAQTYQFFNNRNDSFDANIADVNQMRNRFADPATLTD
ncbi:MAG: hypothetical protein PHV36_13970 [Elusimicrobiales bacterium]|nr:hypothetical protein [Elusimicrobiales bacterium]